MASLQDEGIDLQPARFARALALVIAFLVLAHLVVMYVKHGLGHDYAKGFVPLFHLGEEMNVPTVFSTALFYVGALGFYALHIGGDATARPGDKHWLILAVLFVFLGVDEGAHIHEMWVEPLRGLGATGIFHYAWVIPYGVGVLILAAYLLPRLLRLTRRIRLLFFYAAGFYVFGALGMELVEGYMFGTGSWVVALAVLIEESLEMIGLTALIYAQWNLLASHNAAMTIRFGHEAGVPSRETKPS